MATPISPSIIDVRRCKRSTISPFSGESSPDNSLIATATPMPAKVVPLPRAMIARNGGAKRTHELTAVRATVSSVMRSRTSAGMLSSSVRCSMVPTLSTLDD